MTSNSKSFGMKKVENISGMKWLSSFRPNVAEPEWRPRENGQTTSVTCQ